MHADEDADAEHDSGGGQQPAQQVLARVGPTDEAEQNHAWRYFLADVGNDVAVAQADRARAAFGHGVIVRDHQHRRAQAVVQIVNQLQDLRAGVGVQIAGGLIGKQNRREDAERAGDGHALALAAGEFVGQVIEAGAQLHEFEQLAGALVDLFAGPSAQVQRQRDVFQAGQRRQQVEELENETDLVAAHAREVVVAERR